MIASSVNETGWKTLRAPNFIVKHKVLEPTHRFEFMHLSIGISLMDENQRGTKNARTLNLTRKLQCFCNIKASHRGETQAPHQKPCNLQYKSFPRRTRNHGTSNKKVPKPTPWTNTFLNLQKCRYPSWTQSGTSHSNQTDTLKIVVLKAVWYCNLQRNHSTRAPHPGENTMSTQNPGFSHSKQRREGAKEGRPYEPQKAHEMAP